MGLGRYTFAANSVLFFALAYLSLVSPLSLFGVSIRYASPTRVLAVMLVTFAILSVTTMFENAITRIYVAKIFVVFHGLMMLMNFYNFVSASVSFLAVAIHFVFALLFLGLVIRGVGRYD